MPNNWLSLTLEHVKATGNDAVIQAALAKAAQAGNTLDPVQEAIENAVGRIRGAASVGNLLDRDTTKIPRSLKGLALRMVMYALREFIEFALTDDQRDTKRDDNSYLIRISDDKIRFEEPDDAAGSAEMQPGGLFRIVDSRPRQLTRDTLQGL